MITPATFPDLLASRLRRDPGQPLVTAYDERTGERTELSVTTYGNWVSKNANLLVEELGLEPGDTLLVDLPPHWLVPVFLGAAWSAGVVVTTDPALPHDAVVCDPGHVEDHVAAGTREVVCCALLPFAVRSRDPLPAGVHDHGLLWPGQSDVFVGVEPVTPGTEGWADAGGRAAQGDLLDAARAAGLAPGARVITDAHPAGERGVPAFLAALVAGGSLVLVRHPDDATWPARREDERATVELRATTPSPGGQPARR